MRRSTCQWETAARPPSRRVVMRVRRTASRLMDAFTVPAILRKIALHQREIGFSYLAAGEHRRQPGMGGVVLGDQDEAAGLLVEAMHDARDAADRWTEESSRMWCNRALTSVPRLRASSVAPEPAWTIMPAGLLTTARSLSS